MRVLLVLLVACSETIVRPPAKPKPARSEATRAPYIPARPAPPPRLRLTLTGLVGPDDQITGDHEISRVQFRTIAEGFKFVGGSGPRVYAMLSHEIACMVYGKERVEEIHIFTPEIANDGDFQIGQLVDGELAARLTRDRCSTGRDGFGTSRISCKLDGFEVLLDGELPVRQNGWSLAGHKITSVGVRVWPANSITTTP